ncbi:pyruvate ferredoxin oxidoreductase [Campylobacter sp. RM10532]|uniref:pyruvate ferredoxin oxidoreductase n=1 Tax=Campylobacter molothri TaxID=1032242 RepID=UPI001DC2DED7|nr:pyruvate ferredoxin oxidoreductase [Campylobacter sp. RM10532]MBZ7948611.1 pyruvate ferredoxin oxidoreductase [Campylobacter sp. RM9929]
MKVILFFILMMVYLNICSASALDEILKDVEVSGVIRYTYGTSKGKNIHGYNFNKNDINMSKIN